METFMMIAATGILAVAVCVDKVDTRTYIQECKRTDVVLAATKSINADDSTAKRGYWIQLTCPDGTVIYDQPK